MIIGHNRQIEYFNKVLSRGRLAHAYLFYGPEHIGKFTVAGYLAGLFDNPELIILDRERTLVSKKDARKDIPIEDIRELKRRFSFAPEGERWRIAIINDTHNLSPAAADAFLKILEEPGERTLFILITSAKDALLPTIVSRTQPIRFSLVPDDTLLEFVKKSEKDKSKQELILAITAGRPGVAARLLGENGYLESELKFLKGIDSVLSKRDVPEALILAEKMASSEELRGKAIEYVLRILRKNLLDGAGGSLGGAVVNHHTFAAGVFLGADLKKIKEIYPESGESSHLKSVVVKLKNTARFADILETTNVNPRLAMDNILLEAMKL